MAKKRADLSKVLREILGNNHVYFQPPNGTKIEYPCIIYKLESLDAENADDMKYIKNKRYTLNVIDYNPDSETYEKILDAFDYASLDRMAVNNNLNHWYMTIYW